METTSPKKVIDKERAENDTGYLCREVLGFDYDRNEDTGEITRPGGIYPRGAHNQMCKFLDDTKQLRKQIMCPRGARKTTILVGYCVRRILKDPNIRILYAMQTYSEAQRTVAQVREILEFNETIKEIWGDQKGDSKQWKSTMFTVGARTDVALRDPTMMAGGLGKTVTGSHPDLIILDDMVDWTNVGTPEAIDKPITYLKLCFPLLEKGGTIIECGTPYDEGDIHHYVKNELSSQFTTMEIPCGMEIVVDKNGGYDLEGRPRFPHLTAKYLRAELQRMGPTDFAANYCLKCSSPEDQMFFREQFLYEEWQDWMSQLSGYILTDTATSNDRRSSYSVIALVLVAHDDTAYLADLRVNMWKPGEFADTLLDVYHYWRPKCRLHCALLENVALNHVYRSVIDSKARERQIPLRMVGVPRGIGASAKLQRINSLQPRFASRKFIVLNTVPDSITVRGKKRCLFNPYGFNDPETGAMSPAGMLVDQFIRNSALQRDIPDCLADIEAADTDRRRICVPSPKPAWRTSKMGGRWRVKNRDESRPDRPIGFSWAKRGHESHRTSWSEYASRGSKS